MAFEHGDWSLVMAPEVPWQDEWPANREPVSVPAHRNGLPLPVPYTYRGGDHSTPEPARMRFSRKRAALRAPASPPVTDEFHWLRAYASWLDVPFSAPREWHAEMAAEDAWEAS